MKKTLLASIVLTLMVISFTACQSASQTIRISEQDAGRTITMNTGDILIIELEGNITTGFNWVPAPQDPILLNQIGEPEVTPESSLVGAPGMIVIQFEAVAEGQTILHLDYKQPWEAEVKPEKSFEITVVVK